MFNITALLLLSALLAVPGQDRPPQIRSGIELVSIDVQVVDGKGQPVADLEPGDFEVTIGGRRRIVQSAELVRYGSSQAVAPGAPAAPPEPVGEPGSARPRRMFVIAIDEHSIRVGAAKAAMEAARRFIGSLEPTDLVGLFAYPSGTAKLDLTTDHASVLAGLDKVGALFDPPISRYNISAAEAIDIASQDRDTLSAVLQRECGTDPYCRRQLPLEAHSIAIMMEMTLTQSLAGLRGLVAGLGNIPGRKVLVLVSGGLAMTDRGGGRVNESQRMNEVGRLAASTNTTLYALHMDSAFMDAFAERRMSNTMFRDANLMASGLDRMAGAAGGTVFRVTTGKGDSAFDRVLRETSAHYLLGVEVTDEDRNGEAHHIRVQVKRRAVTVRSRSSVVIPK